MRHDLAKANLTALLAGLVFGAGLGISGMTRPERVLGFLDVAGDWDPSLALVMVGAIAVHATLYRRIRRRSTPWFDDHLHVPVRRDVDGKLVAGAALFGVGWGLGGYCPGPALVSLVTGQRSVLVFVGAMLAGMALEQVVIRRRGGPASMGR